MCQHQLLVTFNIKNTEFTQPLKQHIERMLEHIKYLEYNSNLTNNSVNKIRFDLQERYELRNNYYHRKLPLLLHDLCIIRSNKHYFQIIKQEHNQSKQFYKKLCNIQSSSINTQIYQQQLQQSIKILSDLKADVNQYENYIDGLKREVINKNHQMTLYADKLFQIQYEQTQTQSDIKQLKKQILCENQLYDELKRQYANVNTSSNIDEVKSEKIFQEKLNEHIDELYHDQQSLKNQEFILRNNLENIKDLNQHQLNQLHIEYVNLMKQMSHTEINIKNKFNDVLPLQNELSAYHKSIHIIKMNSAQLKTQPTIVPMKPKTKKTNTQDRTQEPAPLFNKINKSLLQPVQKQHQTSIKSANESELTKYQARKKSLGPNLQSRLEALEAAMGVRLNLAKKQGRHSLSNTAAPSPMQLSPTSSSSTMNSFISNSLALSSHHNASLRSGQGVQRSASSCDAENRLGPRKRLKPSVPNENSILSSSNVAAIATIKKYPPTVRRPLTTTNVTPTRPTQSKQSTPIKPRASPMDTSSPRLSRLSTTSNNSSSNSSNYRTPIGSISPKISSSPSPKPISTRPSPKSTSTNPSPRQSVTNIRKKSSSIFGEQFSDEIIKVNLLWISLNELDDESRAEVILQFGSIDNYVREQNHFFRKQLYLQQQSINAPKNKTITNRSRFHLSLTKKDRLELL